MIKVVQLEKARNSAGRAASRLHNAFLEAGVDSSILSLEIDINDTEKIWDTGTRSRIIARFDSSIKSSFFPDIDDRLGSYSYPILGTDVSRYEQVRNADVIYMHWVLGGFLNISCYRKLAKRGKPVVIFMHDMWTITGGCHHSFDCNKYKTRCHNCPMFLKETMIDMAARQFDKKKKLYSSFDNLHFVSPSTWLMNCARESFLTKDKPLYNIPNVINDKLFKPLDKTFARRLFNLNNDDIVIAFGAITITSPYKGANFLFEALKILKTRLKDRKVSVLIFGSGFNKDLADKIPFETKFIGYLHDEYSTILAYNSADLFVSPSLADNLPTTILESLSCGTPVVSFKVGGIPDMILHRQNGYLAEYRNADDLATGMLYCLENNTMGYLLPSFRKEVIIGRHLELINSIV